MPTNGHPVIFLIPISDKLDISDIMDRRRNLHEFLPGKYAFRPSSKYHPTEGETHLTFNFGTELKNRPVLAIVTVTDDQQCKIVAKLSEKGDITEYAKDIWGVEKTALAALQEEMLGLMDHTTKRRAVQKQIASVTLPATPAPQPHMTESSMEPANQPTSTLA